MSVINQMLRDLDQRQAHKHSSQPVSPMMTTNKAGHSRVIIAGLLLVITAIVAAFYSYSRLQQTSETTQVSPSLETQSGPLIETTANQLKESAEVIDSDPLPAPLAVSEPEPQPNSDITTVATTVAEKPSELMTEQPPVVTNTTNANENSAPKIIKHNPNESLRSQAQALYQQLLSENGSLSANHYQQILALDPTFHQMRQQWLIQLMDSDRTRFRSEVEQAMQRWPDVHQYRQMLARDLVTSDPAQAYEVLMVHMPTIEKAPDYHGMIAYSAQQMGELSLAQKKYQFLLENFPERADWWLALALLEEQLGDKARALIAYQQSLRFPGLTTNTRSYAQQRVKVLRGY